MTVIYAGMSALATAFAAWIGAAKMAEQPLRGKRLCICVAVCSLAGLLCGCFLPEDSGYISITLRIVAALAGLTGAAVCDWREKKIPNLFPFVLLIASVVACVLDQFIRQDAGLEIFVGSMLSGGLIFLLLLLFRGFCHLILHQAGIGWGDIKLLAALGCLAGLNITISTLLLGEFAAMVGSIALLVTHKVGIKDGIAFAPFIYTGFFITVCLGIL